MFTRFDAACLACFLLTKKNGLSLLETLDLLLALDSEPKSNHEFCNALIKLYRFGLVGQFEVGVGATSYSRSFRDLLILNFNTLDFIEGLHETILDLNDRPMVSEEDSIKFKEFIEQTWSPKPLFDETIKIAISKANLD